MPEPDESDPKDSLCQQRSDMVLSWVPNSLSPELASHIIYIETLAEILFVLEKCFFQGDFSQYYKIQQSIVEL